MMMKIAATTMKVGMRFPLREAKVCPLRTSSGYEIRNPRAESFKIDHELADDGGQHAVMACGSRTSRKRLRRGQADGQARLPLTAWAAIRPRSG